MLVQIQGISVWVDHRFNVFASADGRRWTLVGVTDLALARIWPL